MSDTVLAHRRPTTWWGAVLLCLSVAGAEPAARPTLELVQTIPLQGPAGRLDHLALDAKGKRLFLANQANNSLDVVDLEAGKLVKSIPRQRKIQGVAYVPDLNRIFVGNGVDGVCNVFDGRDYKLLCGIELEKADNVLYDPRSQQVYVTHKDTNLSVIDPKTLKVKATIKLPGAGEGFKLHPSLPRLFLNVQEPSRVVAIDTRKNEIVAQFPVKSARENYPLAVVPASGKGGDDAGRVFVGCRDKPRVVVLNAKTGKEVASVEIPGDVDDIAYDAKRRQLYAACGEGSVAIISVKGDDRYEVVERVATGKLARTCLFDPASRRLYVAVPRQNDRTGPRLHVYRVRD